jgi:hypothetical protein
MSCQLDIYRKGVAKAGVEVDQAGLVGADGSAELSVAARSGVGRPA